MKRGPIDTGVVLYLTLAWLSVSTLLAGLLEHSVAGHSWLSSTGPENILGQIKWSVLNQMTIFLTASHQHSLLIIIRNNFGVWLWRELYLAQVGQTECSQLSWWYKQR